MQATRLTLICHARTVAQKLGRFPANEPVELEGQAAGGAYGARFKKPPRLLCGPELRTRQTAELFGNDAEIVEALRDCDFGRWSGLPINDLQRSEPAALTTWLGNHDSAPHGGESVSQLGERVAKWLNTLAPTTGHIVAITHPFVIRAALSQVLQAAAFNQIDVEPLAAIELRFTDRWRLRLPGTEPGDIR